MGYSSRANLSTRHRRAVRGGAGVFFAAAVTLFISCLCLLPAPPTAHASLAPSELNALLDLKAACRSTIYSAAQFLTTWKAVRFKFLYHPEFNISNYNISITCDA